MRQLSSTSTITPQALCCPSTNLWQRLSQDSLARKGNRRSRESLRRGTQKTRFSCSQNLSPDFTSTLRAPSFPQCYNLGKNVGAFALGGHSSCQSWRDSEFDFLLAGWRCQELSGTVPDCPRPCTAPEALRGNLITLTACLSTYPKLPSLFSFFLPLSSLPPLFFCLFTGDFQAGGYGMGEDPLFFCALSSFHELKSHF